MSRRSRFGCQTCKIRRVKCDETQPFCRRCTESGRRCEGPSKNKTIFVVATQDRRRSSPPNQTHTHAARCSVVRPQQRSLAPVLPATEHRSLSFFVQRAAPALGAELDREFWQTSLLQMCYQSDMVRSAVLAISTLYEHPLDNALLWPTSIPGNFSLPQQQQAFKWYSQSLKGMAGALTQTQNQDQLLLSLTSCILFACIESQQLNTGNSLELMKCGYRLLSQPSAANLIRQNTVVEQILLPLFIRQTGVLVMHGHPIPAGWLLDDYKRTHSPTQPFNSLRDGRTMLHMLMLDARDVVNRNRVTDEEDVSGEARQTQIRMLNQLTMWRRNLDAHVSKQPTMTAAEMRALSILHLNYNGAIIWLSMSLEPDEMAYDNLTPNFIAILDSAEAAISNLRVAEENLEYTYTFDMRVVIPVLYTGLKCRIPHIRRRALQILKSAPAHESLFHRDVHLWTLRKVIEHEEGLQHKHGDALNIEDMEGVFPGDFERLRHVVVLWDRQTQFSTLPQLEVIKAIVNENGERSLKTMIID